MEKKTEDFLYSFILALGILMIGVLLASLCLSCTLSMQNVMTSGTASDIVDTNPTTDAQSSLSIPTKAL